MNNLMLTGENGNRLRNTRIGLWLTLTALIAVSVGYGQQRRELRDNRRDMTGLAINIGEANKTMERMEAENAALKLRLSEAQARHTTTTIRTDFPEGTPLAP